ncbi:serine hydrolase domain-containing protein [candidate division KSB1 bacterium]
MKQHFKYFTIFFCITLICFLNCKKDKNITGPSTTGPVEMGETTEDIEEFELRLEDFRRTLHIPGCSYSIAKNGNMVRARGFGFADVENGIKATPNTQYRLASLTKTFASTVIMQLVEEGLINLEDPVSDYGIELESPGIIRVKHLFTHTSEGVPGSYYQYNGGRYLLLDQVIEQASGKTFAEQLAERIVIPLGLRKTGPTPFVPAFYQITGLDASQFIRNLALGYSSAGALRQNYPIHFSSAAGLISTVIEVAEYSIAVDNNTLMSEETKQQVFTPAVSNSGETLPYGLGWFVQYEQGTKIIWHYGWWDAISSLIIKIPENELAFIICANNDRLSGAYPGLGYGDITVSDVAMEFLDTFVFGTGELPETSLRK